MSLVIYPLTKPCFNGNLLEDMRAAGATTPVTTQTPLAATISASTATSRTSIDRDGDMDGERDRDRLR